MSGFAFRLRRALRIALALWIGALVASSAPAPGRAQESRPIPLKLPAPIVYERAVGAGRAVAFRHESHVALASNRCIGCHPEPFRMLRPAGRIVHADMDSGGSCGLCHDGRQAFGVRDSSACQTCHAGRNAATLAGREVSKGSGAPVPRLPAPVTFHRGESSPGNVRFEHASHLKGGARCATCHPKPFRMSSTGGRPGGAMHAASACGGCHDGVHAFGVEDAEACGRCHREVAP